MSQRIGMVDIAWMAGQQNERMRGEAEAKEGELAKERLSFLKINRASLLASEAVDRREEWLRWVFRGRCLGGKVAI